MTEKEKMLSGKLYFIRDEHLRNGMLESRNITGLYNNTTHEEKEYRKELLKKLFEKIGNKIHIEAPLRCDYGCHVSIGDNFYANYDCIIIAVNKVKIGNNVFLGPRVCIYTSGHPIDATIRNTLLGFGKPVTIGDNVWIGGNTVINPGVVIGNNTVIGSGSVVTKNIPDNVVAAGNPCKALRSLTEEDGKFWEEEKRRSFL